MTSEQYASMLESQNGVCAACGCKETATTRRKDQKIRRLAVDHNHKTGEIRGLLCVGCNRALGQLADDPERIEALLKYIRKFTA